MKVYLRAHDPVQREMAAAAVAAAVMGPVPLWLASAACSRSVISNI